MAEEKLQTPPEEVKEEKPAVVEPTAEELKQEVVKLKASEKGWQDSASKWQRKHDELKEQAETKPEETYKPEVATDPTAGLREQYDTDPFATSVHMADRAGRHYAEQVRKELVKENKAKRQLRRSYKDFDNYEDRVDDFMGKMVPDKRTQDMYEMAYKVAKTEAQEDQDLDKIKKEAKEEGLKEGAEKKLEEAKEIHEASIPRGGAPKESKTAPKLSELELKMATRYGMTPEAWQKSKETKVITGGEKARFEK